MDSENIMKLASFFMSIVLSLVLSVFCIVMIVRNQNETLYISLLSSVVGLWMPSPFTIIAKSQNTTMITNTNTNTEEGI